jgi:hypothetical protein
MNYIPIAVATVGAVVVLVFFSDSGLQQLVIAWVVLVVVACLNQSQSGIYMNCAFCEFSLMKFSSWYQFSLACRYGNPLICKW